MVNAALRCSSQFLLRSMTLLSRSPD